MPFVALNNPIAAINGRHQVEKEWWVKYSLAFLFNVTGKRAGRTLAYAANITKMGNVVKNSWFFELEW